MTSRSDSFANHGPFEGEGERWSSGLLPFHGANDELGPDFTSPFRFRSPDSSSELQSLKLPDHDVARAVQNDESREQGHQSHAKSPMANLNPHETEFPSHKKASEPVTLREMVDRVKEVTSLLFIKGEGAGAKVLAGGIAYWLCGWSSFGAAVTGAAIWWAGQGAWAELNRRAVGESHRSDRSPFAVLTSGAKHALISAVKGMLHLPPKGSVVGDLLSAGDGISVNITFSLGFYFLGGLLLNPIVSSMCAGAIFTSGCFGAYRAWQKNK